MMRTGFAIWCLAAVAAGAVSAADQGEYDGLYRQTANAECGLIGVDGGALKVAEGVFYGVNGRCTMTDPVNVLEMDATLYTMECDGGTGDWAARAMFLHAADDGLIVVWDGYAFKYDRCPAPPADNPPLDAAELDAAKATAEAASNAKSDVPADTPSDVAKPAAAAPVAPDVAPAVIATDAAPAETPEAAAH